MRTLIISHGHPNFSIGGAEVASYTLYTALNTIAGEQAFYLAKAPVAIHQRASSPLMSLGHGERECFFQTQEWDEFWLSNAGISGLAPAISEYLRFLNPDVVHFHHVIGIGVEGIALVRKTLPTAKIIITFHEYLAICHNHGQMVKRGKRDLCKSSSPHDCKVCFSSRTISEFYERKSWIANHLQLADAFVSPSQFLLERYVDWGLPREKFTLIDNGISGNAVCARQTQPGGKRNRFAYFGQISEFKGLHVVLEAISSLPQEVWGDASLSVFGGNLEFQPDEFQSRFGRMLKDVGRRARFCGSYRQDELASLMQDVDWVIVPSIWWENSPVVIQEAFLHIRPVIVSGIGGMAEKVRDGVNGLHFRVGSSESLADQLARALSEPSLWAALSTAASIPLSPKEFAEKHVELYSTLEMSPARLQASASLVDAA